MNMKQITLATATTLALAFTAVAGGHNEPSYSHEGHHKKHSDWSKGWYVGAGVNGDANMSQEFGNTPEWLEGISDTADVDSDDNDVGFDVYVGRKINKHFSAELGYTWVGNQTFTVSHVADDVDNGSIKVEQWNVHAIGLAHWNIFHNVNLFAKGGVAYYANETDIDVVTPVSENASLSTFALTYGAGVEFNWDRFGIRGDYTVVQPNESDRNNYYISDLVGASIFYRF